MDQFDRAQQLEQLQRDQALTAARQQPKEQPLVMNGKRVCVDCEDEIKAARLIHIPNAIRCVSCQVDFERGAR